MKKILTIPLIIMFFVFLIITIITFIVALNYIYLDLYTSLTLSISVISLFATFGGAYLGAKVSGEYATKTMKEQIIMSDLKEKSDDNIKFLNEFSTLNDRYIFKQPLNFSTQLFNYHLTISPIKSYYNKLMELMKLDLNTSQMINFPFEIFVDQYRNIINNMNNLERECRSTIERDLYREVLSENPKYNIRISDDSMIRVFSSNIDESKVIVDYDVVENIPFSTQVINNCDSIELNGYKYKVHFQSKFQKEFIGLEKQIANLYKSYDELSFKNSTDLKRYITKYYDGIIK